MVQRGRRADVELVEDDDAPAGPSGAPEHAGRRPWTRRRRRTAAVAAVVVVGALLAAQSLSDARERAVLADLRAVPGVLDPLPDGPRPLWRTSADRLPVPVMPSGSVLLGARLSPAGTALVALDPATGADAWTLPLSTPPADAPDALGTPLPRCAASPAPADVLPPRLLCLVTDAWQRDAGLLPQEVPPTTSRLLVVRTSDGAVVADHVVDAAPGAPATSVALLDDVAVLGHPVDAGLVVRGVDPASGAELWRHGARPGGGVRAVLPRHVTAVDGAVVVPGPDGLDLLDAHGGLLRHVPVPAGAATEWARRADGVLQVGVRDGGSWRLVGRERDVLLPGPPVHVPVDDGRAGTVVLAASDRGLHVVDTSTGRQRWSVAAQDVHAALVLRGRVHVVGEEGVTTYDARTGASLWAWDYGPEETGAGPVLTDGQDLLVPVGDAESGEARLLRRLAPSDGRTGAPLRLPPDLTSVAHTGGLLVGWALSSDEVAALG
ncbi:outer membrane protein assembly factor BamB family protein [Cellulomonas telluris]|uniref:outer membrane protein assembly factor BamB family protein n=1 Tax=Cellulomonas telluris TaxID=2306636 RepID=UPI0010A788FD|nr:PQQ-binding-like beta-propeller repeat protein [Cellulomonas telluris]